ncbi:MAG: TldD/PmbA family protein, partial [candidate division Zixibacteria bacterium]|nr:TldD/PmbA family protein [candidate division Zixibacteria bacterium]
NKERLELAHWAASQCKKAGADDAAVTITFSRDVNVDHRDRKVDQLTESTQNSLSLSVYLGGRFSNHTTCDLRRDTLGGFIDQAVAMTKYLTPDPDRVITDLKYCQGIEQRDLKLIDSAYESVTAEERVRFARECEEAVRTAASDVVSCTGNYSDSYNESVKVLTNGFEGGKSSTSFSAYAEVTLQDGNGVRVDDYEEGSSCFRRDIPSPEFLGRQAVKRTQSKFGQIKIASGTYDMIIENRTASRMIGGITGALNGASVYRKNSFLIDKLGQQMFSEKLTIIDDPFLESGFGSRLYDGDGMAARRQVMVEKGVPKAYYVDWFYSRKLKMEPTTGGNSNLVYEYGTKSLDDLIKQAKKAILVTSFVGGNSNGTTGDFSYGVIGHYVEDGKIVHPVNEMNVSGNFIALWINLAEMGNDPYLVSTNRRPSIYFKDVSFAGL